ncbi:MAG: hypothetical protein WCG13_15015 [Burkholderiales bacterium]
MLHAIAQAWLSLSIGNAPDCLAIWLPGQLLGETAIGLISGASPKG